MRLILRNGARATVPQPELALNPAAPDPGRLAEIWANALNAVLSDPPPLAQRRSLKISDTVRVYQSEMALGETTLNVVCKQDVRGRFRKVLASILLRSRERRGFDRARALLREGIPTARPIALIEHGFPRRCAWLITEFIPGLVDLDQVALSLLNRAPRSSQRRLRDRLITALVELAVALERARWHHRDFKASNILIRHGASADAPAGAVLIDLDGLKRLRIHRSRSRRLRPIVRLAASLAQYSSIPQTDYVRFLKRYLAAGGEQAASWRDDFRALSRRVSDYNRRADTRRRAKPFAFNSR